MPNPTPPISIHHPHHPPKNGQAKSAVQPIVQSRKHDFALYVEEVWFCKTVSATPSKNEMEEENTYMSKDLQYNFIMCFRLLRLNL